jgi:hypothetical protein
MTTMTRPAGLRRGGVRAQSLVGMRIPLVVLVALAASAAAAAGCGGASGTAHDRPAAQHTATEPPVGSTPAPGLDPKILPPKRVPHRGHGAASPAARHVIEAWLRELRAGHLRRAAHYFAVPSVFQNASPVMHLDSERAVRAVVASFPCGAVATHYAAAGRYTLVRFRLTERTGGDCHGAAGNTTGGAIRVARGRIREWYRLYDPEEIHPTGPLVDPGRLSA